MEPTQLGTGWEMHFGRIRRQSSHACTNPNGSNSSSSPVLETQDGSQKQLVYNNYMFNRSNAVYITKDYWHAYCLSGQTGLLVIDPNGTRHWMTYRVFSASRYFSLSSYVWYVTKIQDRNGNTMNFTYDSSSRGEKVKISTITTSDNRTVRFEYDSNDRLARIKYMGRTVTYGYRDVVHNRLLDRIKGISTILQSVTYPNGRTRRYTYYLDNEGFGYYENFLLLRRATRRAGGHTDYYYRYLCKAITGCGVIRNGNVLTAVTYNHAISSKVDNDLNGNATTWGFTYSFSNGFDFTSVTFPGGRHVYKHYSGTAGSNGSFPNYARVGLLDSKTTYNGGSVIQTESYEYQTFGISTQNTSRFPSSFYGVFDNFSYGYRVTRKTINRDGKNYITSYQDFADGRNPHTIVETGNATRTMTLTYKDVSPLSNSPKLAYVPENESYSTEANRKIERTFDDKGRVTLINSYGVPVQYTYHENGDIASMTDALNQTITYDDYYRGIPRTESLPEDITVTRTVTAEGWVTSQKDGRGNTTSYQYDGSGRLTGITPPRGSATTMTWSKEDNKDVQTVTRGNYLRVLTYDGFGRVVCDKRGEVHSGTVYDGLGRVSRQTLPNYSSCTSNQDINYTYDSLGRLLITTHVDRSYNQHTYETDNKLKLRDEAGKVFNFQYRSYGNPDLRYLMAITGPASLSVAITRNVLGQETEIKRNVVKRTFDYGDTQFVMSEKHPETGTTTYTRDALGNIIGKRVGASGTTRYYYDNVHRLERVDYPRNTSPDLFYTYDKNSNVTRMRSGITDFTYVYDQNDNLIQENQKIDGATYATKYTYSNLDHLSTLRYHDNVVVSYAPNDLGWPTKAAPYVNGVTYHPNGAPSQITYANGRKTTYTLNNRQWALRATTDGGISNQEVTAYDGVGNIKSIRDYLNSSNNRTLTYDGLHRLKTATGPWGTGSITYSPRGDIRSKRMGTTNLSYSYVNGKITSVSGLPNFITNANYSYDTYGNVIKKQSTAYGWTYEYDDASNLKKVFDHSNSLIRSFEYSGNNMKVKSVSPNEHRRFIYGSAGNLLSNVRVTGSRPTIHNIYLGSTLVAEVERNVTNPNTQINADAKGDIYGYGFGSNNHKHFVKGYFNLSSVSGPLKLCVNGFGINSATEVSVQVNGNSIGFLESGPSPKRSCFTVPSNYLVAGRNIVTFTQSNPGNTWGVQFLSVGNGSATLPGIIMLLLDEEEAQ